MTIVDQWLVPFQAGHFEAAAAILDAALIRNPRDLAALRARILHADYMPDTSAAEQLARRVAYARLLPTQPHGPIRDPDPDRPLKIGYLSGNLQFHSAAFGFEVARHHDPPAVWYHSGPVDQATSYFYQGPALWRGGCDWAPAAVLADKIRKDQIDILVDLAGHTDGGRPEVFALCPAPVQVVAWGYACTTGTPWMDYLLTDPVHCPPGYQGQYITEQPWYLPSFLSHDASKAYEPPYPRKDGPIRFGYGGHTAKLNPVLLEMWAKLLGAVPDSELWLCYGGFDDAARQGRILEAQACDPARVHFEGAVVQDQHLKRLSRVDIALDSYPHGGGVTTIESLLAGVPVVTRQDTMLPARAAASLLHSVQLPYDLVAHDEASYIRAAVWLARDESLRLDLRMRLAGMARLSPVCDLKAYHAALEEAYREMWQQKVAQPARVVEEVSA